MKSCLRMNNVLAFHESWNTVVVRVCKWYSYSAILLQPWIVLSVVTLIYLQHDRLFMMARNILPRVSYLSRPIVAMGRAKSARPCSTQSTDAQTDSLTIEADRDYERMMAFNPYYVPWELMQQTKSVELVNSCTSYRSRWALAIIILLYLVWLTSVSVYTAPSLFMSQLVLVGAVQSIGRVMLNLTRYYDPYLL